MIASHSAVRDVVRRHGGPMKLGRVSKVVGLLVETTVCDVSVGDVVHVAASAGNVVCQVVGFRDGRSLAIPLGEIRGIGLGALVRHAPGSADVAVGREMCGRVVDAFGRAIDGGPPLTCRQRVLLDGAAPAINRRGQVDRRFDTGIRVIDGLLTCGRGQRVGIFAGAGVGKSVLVEQIASQSDADVIVVGLIGERGREVRELMALAQRDSMVVVAATSDRSPMERHRGALTATAIAEHFRDQGANVLLIIDSLTRYAMALREIGLAVGEPPATKGYPPSVFAALPRLLERVAPMASGGSITGFYTVLVEGDDLADPIADSARSLLDAHIVLSRDMAGRGEFPAVDVLASASRVAGQVTDAGAAQLMRTARGVLSQCALVRELRSLGAYVPGRDAGQDSAVATGARLTEVLAQSPGERSSYQETLAQLQVALKVEGECK